MTTLEEVFLKAGDSHQINVDLDSKENTKEIESSHKAFANVLIDSRGQRFSGIRFYLNQILAIWIRKFLHFFRDPVNFLLNIVIPTVIIVLGFSFATQNPDKSFPELKMSLSQFPSVEIPAFRLSKDIEQYVPAHVQHLSVSGVSSLQDMRVNVSTVLKSYLESRRYDIVGAFANVSGLPSSIYHPPNFIVYFNPAALHCKKMQN